MAVAEKVWVEVDHVQMADHMEEAATAYCPSPVAALSPLELAPLSSHPHPR